MVGSGRVTVFGGAGFIGRHIVRRLARDGWTVTVVSRHARQAGYLQPMGDVGQIARIGGSITDAGLVKEAVAGADAVISLVGILAPSGAQKFDSLHHVAPGIVAKAAKAAGARKFVHLSAIGADATSRSSYARSKALGERTVRDGFPAATILRPSIVFGPEDNFFNRFAEMAVTLPFLPLIGGGKTRFQPVYVGDVADAAIKVLAMPRPAPVYELGGPRILTFRALLEYLLAELSAGDVQVRARRAALLPLPYPVAQALATFLQMLPGAPLTVDQVRLLRRDNVAAARLPGLDDLGITPTDIEAIVPGYLARYRGRGWYSARRIA